LIDALPRESFFKKGRKRLYVRATDNRKLITVMACESAVGNFIPPFLVYPFRKLTKSMLSNAPTDTAAMCTENGCFTSKAFSNYLEHIIAHVRPIKEETALLVLDAFFWACRY
jgi:hypothetical protein